MKKFRFCVILPLAILLFSCGKDCHTEILGKWTLEQNLRQDFKEDDSNPDSYLGNIMIKKTVTFTFNDDLSYEKYVNLTVTEVNPAGKTREDFDMTSFLGNSQTAVIKGTYKANEKKLTLNAETINLNGENFDYADYYVQNPDMGMQKISQKYKKDSDSLVISNTEVGMNEEYKQVQE